MQIVYLSKRPDILAETVTYVENLIDFVTEIVVVCPEGLLRRFRLQSRLPVTLISDREMLAERGGGRDEIADHQMRNWLIRSGLGTHRLIHDEFIMSDDDSRPLVRIPLEHFKHRGKYRLYYYYRLEKWYKRESEYDSGLHNTYRILRDGGYPTLSFSSHMPQIYNKEFFARAVKAFDKVGMVKGIDEWSTYFNFCLKEFPEDFSSPEAFETLCWPALPTDWPYDLRPKRFSFENFYPELYGKKMLFHGIPTGFSPDRHLELTLEKVGRRLELQAEYDRMRDLLDLSSAFSREMGLFHHEIRFGKGDYSFLITGLPKIVFARSGWNVDLDINVKAEGKPLTAEAMKGGRAVRLSLHWLDRNGVCFSFGWIRQPLPEALAERGSAPMVLRIPLRNRKPGIYILCPDMVQGRSGWFDGENFSYKILLYVY